MQLPVANFCVVRGALASNNKSNTSYPRSALLGTLMKRFYDLKIAHKLLLSFGAVLLMTVALGVSNIYSMKRMNEASDALARNWMPSVQAVMKIRADAADLRRWELAHLLNEAPETLALYEKRMDSTLSSMARNREQYGKLVSSAEEKALYEEFEKTWGQLSERA